MNKTTIKLVESGMLIALSAALSFIKLIHMPFGGSVTLFSMLPVMLISYRHGVKWGLGSAFAYSLVHMNICIFAFGDLFSWGLSPQAIVSSMFLDYIFAFSSLGLAGIFGRKFWQYMLGMIFAVALRYVFHVVSGVVIFGSTIPKNFSNPLVYSLLYNLFLLPELALCLIAGAVLYVPLEKYIKFCEKQP